MYFLGLKKVDLIYPDQLMISKSSIWSYRFPAIYSQPKKKK